MSFCCFQFSQKTNKNNSTWGTIVVKSNFFIHFLGVLKIPRRHFEINWPLTSITKNVFENIIVLNRSMSRLVAQARWFLKQLLAIRNSFQCLLLFPTLLYVETWVRIDNNAIQMKLPNRTDTNIYECKSSLFLSASTEVKKCTTWTVKFVVNELLPTHLHYLVKSRLLRALLKTHYITIGYWTTFVNPLSLVYRQFRGSLFRVLLPEPIYNMGYLNCCCQPL